MCFAPEADAVVGGIVIAVGTDALRQVSAPKQLALASIPLLLGLHQLTEAFVWWGLQGNVSHDVERAAVWTYLLFAFVVLPVLIPVAVWLIEPLTVRRRIMVGFGSLAVVVAAALAAAMFRGPINAAIEGRHVAYNVDALSAGSQWTALYVIATCGALIVCSYRDIAAFGVLNLVAVPVLMWLTVSGFVSVWCFWAAIGSVGIDLHLRRNRVGTFSPGRGKLVPGIVEA